MTEALVISQDQLAGAILVCGVRITANGATAMAAMLWEAMDSAVTPAIPADPAITPDTAPAIPAAGTPPQLPDPRQLVADAALYLGKAHEATTAATRSSWANMAIASIAVAEAALRWNPRG